MTNDLGLGRLLRSMTPAEIRVMKIRFKDEPAMLAKIDSFTKHQLVGPVDVIDGIKYGICFHCDRRDVSENDSCDG